jgi:stage II sporulation protein D
MEQAAAKLKSLLKGNGSFVGIRVLKRGVSPRVITAEVVGTEGSREVSGFELQHIFGLLTNYEIFTTITTVPGPGSSSVTPAAGPSRAAETEAVAALVPLVNSILAGSLPELHGTVFPARAGDRVIVQAKDRGAWKTVGLGRISRGSGYDLALPGRGTYRVVFDGVAGPPVTVS